MIVRPLCPVVLVLGCAFAQTQPPITTANVQADYPDETGVLPDHASYLATLLRRHAATGFRVLVRMPAAAATRHAASSPPYALSALEVPKARVSLQGLPGIEFWTDADPDAFDDLVGASLRPDAETHLERMVATWRYVHGHLADGPGVPHGAALLLELFPRSGRAHAFAYLDAVWYRADFEGARAGAEAALTALAADSWPLVCCCDLVLRADPHDRALAASIARALAPVVAAAPAARLAQLCSLRARLRADPAKVTAADVEQVLHVVADDRTAATTLAEILANAPAAASVRPLAERALAAAVDRGAGGRAFDATEVLVALRGADAGLAARRVELFVREHTQGKADAYALNNLAWQLLVGMSTMGRYDAVALALMERVQRESGDRISDAHLDTLALALYGNGRFDDAIARQQQAIANTDGDPRYECRLRRYERARELVRRR